MTNNKPIVEEYKVGDLVYSYLNPIHPRKILKIHHASNPFYNGYQIDADNKEDEVLFYPSSWVNFPEGLSRVKDKFTDGEGKNGATLRNEAINTFCSVMIDTILGRLER